MLMHFFHYLVSRRLMFLFICAMPMFTSIANSQVVVRDSFDDESITDGDPVRWSGSTGLAELTDDGLRLTSTPFDVSVLNVDQTNSTGWSVRAQVRRHEGEVTGIGVSGSTANSWAYLNDTGRLQIGQNIAVITGVPLDLDPALQDVIMQFDSFDDEIRAWAWLPGNPPLTEEPMISASLNTQSNVGPGIWVRNYLNNDGDSSSTYAWVEFSESHIPVTIPEPTSTPILLVVGLVLAVMRMRRTTLR